MKKAKPKFGFGWKMGFEPTTNGTTIRYSNQLSYSHRLRIAKINNLFYFVSDTEDFYRISVD
jgi:hypothetical protein